MRILYAVQGTGNGHVSRAREILPLLMQQHEVDILVSGIQADVELPYRVRYKCYGLSFIFGKKGGVDMVATYRQSRLRRLLKDVKSLPVHRYDLVINDFEPVSAWACRLAGLPCIGLSHQSAVLHPLAPLPQRPDPLGRAILQRYAPVTAAYGFHFERYGPNIFTPVIRSEVRRMPVDDQGHYTVYLPAYDDARLLKMARRFPHIRWEIFSKHNRQVHTERNITVRPISNQDFIRSLAGSTGVLCGAGFETPAEALFLKKKLLVVPMKNQYEQQCNAAALRRLGVPVIPSLKKKHLPTVQAWLDGRAVVQVHYPDETQQVLDQLLQTHAGRQAELPPAPATLRAHSFQKHLTEIP